VAQTKAPMNEALAAGMLLLAGWDGRSNFVDFMCGSGTLLIEAALIALNIPPGIYHKHFAFENWIDFDPDLFEEISNNDSLDRSFDYKIYGSDLSPRAIEIAQKNVKSAGLSKYIELKVGNFVDFEPPKDKYIIVLDPPYGERLLENNIVKLYNNIGTLLKHRCQGTTAWIISSNKNLMKAIGLKPSAKINLLNGSLPCEFCRYDMFSGKRNDFLASKSSLKVFSDSTTDTVAFTQVVSTSFSKSTYFKILFKSSTSFGSAKSILLRFLDNFSICSCVKLIYLYYIVKYFTYNNFYFKKIKIMATINNKKTENIDRQEKKELIYKSSKIVFVVMILIFFLTFYFI